MFAKARAIMRDYKQYKTADQYTDNLRPLHEEMFPHIPMANRILDIGSAYAVLPLMMKLSQPGSRVVASDMTTKFTNLKMLKDKGIEWYCPLNLERDEKVETVNVTDKSWPHVGAYDLITMAEVLEHLNSNPLPSLRKIWKALAPGGYIVCSTPAKELHGTTVYLNDGGKPGLWNDLDSWRDIPEYTGKWKDQHTFHYDQFELVSLFTEAGFEIEDCTTIGDFSHLIIGRKP